MKAPGYWFGIASLLAAIALLYGIWAVLRERANVRAPGATNHSENRSHSPRDYPRAFPLVSRH
jgi:hypothetical protein